MFENHCSRQMNIPHHTPRHVTEYDGLKGDKRVKRLQQFTQHTFSWAYFDRELKVDNSYEKNQTLLINIKKNNNKLDCFNKKWIS